ncbi:MAG: hypothetical protein ACRED5_00765 [Propylenella sp.]
MELGGLFIAIAVGLSALAQIRSDPRITKEFRRQSYAALAFYAVFIGCGIAALLVLLRNGETAAVAAATFIFAWIALGALWLMRIAPRLREPPAWLMKPWSALDWILVAIATGAALVATLG